MNEREKEVIKIQLSDEEKALRELKLAYEKARKDAKQKLSELNARTDMQNLQSIIHQKKYQEALLKQIDGVLDDLNNNQYKTLDEFLQGSYANGYIGSMYDLEGQGIPMTVPIDPKKVVRAVRTDSKLSARYYQNRILPENLTKLKLSVKVEVTRGIASGKTWLQVAEQIANGMNSPFNKAMSDAMRIVRTEGHRVNQQGFVDAGDVAKSKGADIVKQWDATLDSRTRPWHQEVDGQIREWEDDFLVHGEKMKAPSIGGSASNVINCRCQLLQRARWALDEDELKTLEERAKFYGLDKTKNFEEYKQKFLQIPETLETKLKDAEKVFSEMKQKNEELDKELQETNQLISASQRKGYSKYDEYSSKEELIAEKKRLESEADDLEKELDEWEEKNPRPRREDFFPENEGDLSDDEYDKCSKAYRDARKTWRTERDSFSERINDEIFKRRSQIIDMEDGITAWNDILKYREANKIGIDTLRTKAKSLEKEQHELLKGMLDQKDEVDKLKQMVQEETAKKEAKKVADSAKSAFKTSHGEYKKYQRETKLGNGTASGYKRISKADVYITPEGVEFEFPVGLNKKKQHLTPEQLTKAWEKVPEAIRKKAPKQIQVLDYYNPQDANWRKVYKNFPHSYATGGTSGVTFYRYDYDHDDDYLVRTLCHEIAHVADESIKTTSGKRFCDDVEWTQAMADDLKHSGKKSPTAYGENANTEDLAESVATYTMDHEWFMQNFPNRAKVLEKYILK